MNDIAEWKMLQAHTRRIREIIEQQDEMIKQNDKIIKRLNEHNLMLIEIFKRLEEVDDN